MEQQAKCDFRDTLLAAEYPGYMKALFRIERLPREEHDRIVDADWRQYQEWLGRP